MANLGSWNTNMPSGASLKRDFDDLYRSDKSMIAGALNEEHYFDSASSASVALHRPGSAVIYGGLASAVSTVAKVGTRLMYETDTGKLRAISSASTLGIKVDPSDIRQSSAATGDVLAWNGSAYSAQGAPVPAFVGAKIYRTTAFTPTQNVWTVVPFFEASKHSRGVTLSSTSSTAIYFTTAGFYEVRGRVAFGAFNDAAQHQLALFKNSTETIDHDRGTTSEVLNGLRASGLEYFASGDSLCGKVNIPGSLTPDGGQCYLEATLSALSA